MTLNIVNKYYDVSELIKVMKHTLMSSNTNGICFTKTLSTDVPWARNKRLLLVMGDN